MKKKVNVRGFDEQSFQRGFNTLRPLVWLFVAIAIMPHLLTLAGQDLMADLLSCTCFPVTMGLLSLVHKYLLVDRFGLLSPMVWMSALLFTLVWLALLTRLWRRNRTVTVAICSLCFVISTEWVWIGILP
ncbi:MAG: hypothetical protein PVH18_13585 [Chloroflexota bacterium]